MAELSVWRVLSYWPAIIFWPAIVAGLAAAGIGIARRRSSPLIVGACLMAGLSDRATSLSLGRSHRTRRAQWVRYSG